MGSKGEKKVAVIGAGVAGLCCARHFSKFPEQFHIQVFEQSQQVGGTWVYCAESGHEPLDVREAVQGDFEGKPAVHSSMYKNLRVNFPKEIMFFPDLPPPTNLPSYPHHHHVLDYLKHYTTTFGLYKFIKFGALVELVEPLPLADEDRIGCVDGQSHVKCDCACQWRITVRDLSSGEVTTSVHDFVVVCSGHFFKPHIPDIPGLLSFPGKVTHSHVYREPEHYTSQSVLVVGGSYSGKDLSLDLSSHASTVYLCNRGKPFVSHLPENVEEVPAISEVRQDGVVLFSDGRERKVESIILATGYLYSFPFLSENSGVSVNSEGTRVFPLYKHIFNPIHQSMAFVGVAFGILPLPAFYLQAHWILSVWKGDNTIPSKEEMLKDIRGEYEQKLNQGIPPYRAGHWIPCQWTWYRELAQLSGGESLSSPLLRPVVEAVYKEGEREAHEDLMHYRSTNFVLLSEEEWSSHR